MPVRLLVVLLLTACGGSPETGTTTPTEEAREPVHVETGSIAGALAGAHRSEAYRARDRYRHPQATLEFFGLEPTMHVVEMAPGLGWYTQVIAPVVRGQGSLTVAIADPESDRLTRMYLERLDSMPEVYDHLRRLVFTLPDRAILGDPGSADMVLTFRSTHGWVNNGGAQQVFQAMFEVLRPGGILGVVQHRADDDAVAAESAHDGYVPEPHVIELATNAGFLLEARSDINRNEADDHDHPRGVWTLPPTLRLGNMDRERWMAVGESDRMTLRFRKPADDATAPPAVESSEPPAEK